MLKSTKAEKKKHGKANNWFKKHNKYIVINIANNTVNM